MDTNRKLLSAQLPEWTRLSGQNKRKLRSRVIFREQNCPEVVLVEQRNACLVARRVRRIQCEFGQEAFARRISGGDLLELDQVSPPRFGVFMDAVQMWFVP